MFKPMEYSLDMLWDAPCISQNSLEMLVTYTHTHTHVYTIQMKLRRLLGTDVKWHAI